MSYEVLQSVGDFITANSLDAGYPIRYFRLMDSRDAGQRLILLRVGGQGEDQILIQGVDADIFLIALPGDELEADARMQQIYALMKEPGFNAGVVQFRPQGSVFGPAYMSDGRPYWRLAVRVYQSF